MKKEPKRFITKFRRTYNLYNVGMSLYDIKDYLVGCAWMALFNAGVRIFSDDVWMFYGDEIFSNGVFRCKGFDVNLFPLLEEIDAKIIATIA